MNTQHDVATGVKYYDGDPVPTGFMSDTQLPSKAVALESYLGEVQKYGMSKEMHAKIEGVAPGTFKRTNARKLTTHLSRTGQTVAVEEISDAVKIAGGVVAASAGIFGLWKLIKYIMSKFGKGKEDKDDVAEIKKEATSAMEAAETKAEEAKNAVESVVKAATSNHEPVDEAVVKLITRGIDDKDYVHRLTELANKHYHTDPVFIPFINAMAHSAIQEKTSAAQFSRTVDLVVKHPLTKRFPQYMFGLATMTHPLPALAVCVLGGKVTDMPTISAEDMPLLDEYANLFIPEYRALMDLDPNGDKYATEVAARASEFKRKSDALNARAPIIKMLMDSHDGLKNALVGIHFNTTTRAGFTKIIQPPTSGPIAEALVSFFEAGGMPVNAEKLSQGVTKIFKEFDEADKVISSKSEDKIKEIEDSAMKGSARSAYVNWIGYLKKQFRTLSEAMSVCRKQQAAIRYGVKWCRMASKSRLPSNKPATENYDDNNTVDLLGPFITDEPSQSSGN